MAQPRERIVGIPLGGDLNKEFGEKMQGIQPEPHFESSPRPIPLPTDPYRGIFVVRVPLSPRRPHLVRRTGAFYKRSDGGSAVKMDIYEVRDQMIGTEERWRKLRLLRLELLGYREATQNILRGNAKPYETYVRFDTQTFKLLLADAVALLPADDDFLRRVLGVPAEASAINQLLDEAHQLNLSGVMVQRPDKVDTYTRAVAEQLANFGNQCHALRRELDSVVGLGFSRDT